MCARCAEGLPHPCFPSSLVFLLLFSWSVRAQELATVVEKKRREFQRRVEALSQAAGAQLAEAERRVSQARNGAARMPELKGLLAHLEVT
jgi:hypothetical protein